ncbi:hypothetical protein EV401DRAFT_2118090 [Pisolithus croceorrhizus]|nr:hypothetical protein EV401DRAFT_2118090 [Pisolithus croceorrhizus]
MVPSVNSANFCPLDEALDQVELKAAIHTLEGACAQLCMTLAHPGHKEMNLVQDYDYSCVRLAVRGKITNILVDYPKGLHIIELSKKINAEPKKLSHIMRLLTMRGCYSEVSKDVYVNMQLSLVLHSENSVSHMVNLHTESVSKGAALIHENLKEPWTVYSYHPGLILTTGPFFDWMRQKSYHRSMESLAIIMSSSAFPFNKYSTVVYIGGGIGAFSLPLAKVHKHMKITVHNLPEALRPGMSGQKYCPGAIQENQVEFSELDFFTQVPVLGWDIYYMQFLFLRLHSAPEPMLLNFGVGNIWRYAQDMTIMVFKAGSAWA